MNSSFSQQNMQRMQYSSLISPEYNFGGMNHRAGQEGVAAKGLNTASAVGAPMAMAGLGLMGMDPMSMGIRAGAATMGSAGFGGAAVAGAAVAAPMALGMAGIGYMGNQMMQGAQQTQAFNANMRSSFSFFNPHSDSGRGFGGSDIREIGNYVRGQSGGHGGGMGGGVLDQFQGGPGFNELGRMAANMGRMGLADGVRNAKEFKEKFSEMIKTVTQIATDMGTTLEEAQKAMASMKGSGIFNKQGSVGGAIRNASVAGGLATTEVTGMMNVGSQISRMFGGTGRQGAMGGIEAISQVGTATKVGALSEEDIYNATGQTGAEGRRAMAQQQMIQSGSFMKSSKGRWMLASLAGRDGKLDANSVADFESGGMSVDDTRNAAHRNLAGVGRANFIRNEGRLRGAVMEKFGGLAPAMAMMGWAQGKGIDINSMGDREMLFMQRQMGMGRDEADALVKMARKMPELMQARREAKQDDAGVQEHQLRSRDSGLEGVKRKLENARDSVNNEMQKVGQDILNSATDKIAEWGNRIAGTYEEHSIEGIREAQRAANLGGARGKEIMQGLVGGGKFAANIKGSGALSSLHEDVGQRNYANRVADLQFSAGLGSAGGMSSELKGLVQSNSSAIKSAYSDELAGLGGEDRMAGFKRKFGKDTEIGKQYRAMDARGQASFMQGMESQIGLKSGLLSETFEKPGLASLRGGGEFRTEDQRKEAWGKAFLGLGTKQTGSGKAQRPEFWGGAMLGTQSPGGAVQDDGDSDAARAAGAMFDKAESRQISFDVLSGVAGAKDGLHMAISNLKGAAAEHGGKMTSEEKGQLTFYNSVDMAADIDAKGGINKLSPKDWDELVEKQKKAVVAVGGRPELVTRDTIIGLNQGIHEGASKTRQEIVSKMAKSAGTDAASDSRVFQARGKDSPLQLGKDGLLKMATTGPSNSNQALEFAMSVQNLGIQAGRSSSPEQQRELLLKQQDAHSSLSDALGNMDVKQLKAYGSQMAGTSFGSEASELLMRGQSLTAGTKKLGAIGAIGNQLGLNLNAEDIAALKGKSAGGGAAALAERLGVGEDSKFTGALEQAIAATMKKGGGIHGAQLLQQAVGQADASTKEKLEKAAKGESSPEDKIIDKIADGNKFLQALVESNKEANAKLSMINNNTNKPADAEKKP